MIQEDNAPERLRCNIQDSAAKEWKPKVILSESLLYSLVSFIGCTYVVTAEAKTIKSALDFCSIPKEVSDNSHGRRRRR